MEENERTLYENLEYLNETKGIIKQAIIDKGVEVSADTPFREYADKIGDIQGGSGDLDGVITAQEQYIEELEAIIDEKASGGGKKQIISNSRYTYCIVPYVRGRERSREPEEILKEIKELASDGYKEITLLGQNVNSYKGNDVIKNFADLLEEVCKIEGIERVRFTSPHPKDFTDDVIETIANNPKICKIIHVPLQSGNTKVLKEMNRKYSKEQYLELIKKIRNKIPNVEFSTDIIVGFPGESEEEFEDTLDVVRKVNFEQIFMFIYSPRIGTIAAKREDQVDENIKHERFTRLQKLYESRVEENNEKYIGKVENVLIEEYSKTNPNMYSARTETNKIVVFEPKQNQKIGDIVKVRIKAQHKWFLLGTIE